jgi:hypothetical protein
LNPAIHRQRMRALEIANGVRTRRSILKRDLAEGNLLISEVLRGIYSDAEGMRVGQLIEAVPLVGKVKADRVLRACRIAPSLPLERLSYTRREQLLACLSRQSPLAPVYREAVAA